VPVPRSVNFIQHTPDKSQAKHTRRKGPDTESGRSYTYERNNTTTSDMDTHPQLHIHMSNIDRHIRTHTHHPSRPGGECGCPNLTPSQPKGNDGVLFSQPPRGKEWRPIDHPGEKDGGLLIPAYPGVLLTNPRGMWVSLRTPHGVVL